MPGQADKNHLLAVRALLLTGGVKKMRDLQFHSPTKIAQLMKMNHSRYTRKLYRPGEFTVNQLIHFASLVDVDPMIIVGMIMEELTHRAKQQ